ncbi:hypothetical protein H0H92_006805, partial [Tricholoma furcatifolium]
MHTFKKLPGSKDQTLPVYGLVNDQTEFVSYSGGLFHYILHNQILTGCTSVLYHPCPILGEAAGDWDGPNPKVPIGLDQEKVAVWFGNPQTLIPTTVLANLATLLDFWFVQQKMNSDSWKIVPDDVDLSQPDQRISWLRMAHLQTLEARRTFQENRTRTFLQSKLQPLWLQKALLESAVQWVNLTKALKENNSPKGRQDDRIPPFNVDRTVIWMLLPPSRRQDIDLMKQL